MSLEIQVILHSVLAFVNGSLFLYLENSDYVTVCGKNSANYLISHKISRDKIHILPNSIDINSYRSLNLEKEYELISIGRLSPEKKLETLIDIFYILKKSKPDIRMAIGGEGPEKETLMQKVKDLDLTDSIDFLGFVEDIEEFYNLGRIFVLTSETEGLPRTAIESISCGTPVVFPNIGDMSDILQKNVFNLMINSHLDKEEYVKVINDLLEDDTLYSRVSKKYQKYIHKNYNHASASQIWNIAMRYNREK